jgi:Fe-S oxidoreductases
MLNLQKKMSTFLFDKIVFGPVNSRRLGISLGINLLPTASKMCNFNCIYCECGWNSPNINHEKLPTREMVKKTLDKQLSQMVTENRLPDVITFAGNGEPTLHPEFETIIDDTIELKNKYCPKAKIAVLSNATRIEHKSVFRALQKVDQNILKLDAASDMVVKVLNQPTFQYSVEKMVNNLKQFEGNFIMQTLFVRGTYQGHNIDNTTPQEVSKWINVVKTLMPKEVMVYTISRDTPAAGLRKVSKKELESIASQVRDLNITVSVSE